VIELDNVWYEYRPGARPIFQQMSIAHAQGILVLIGPTGSGKSTLLRLLAGFLRPQRGRIEVLGINVGRDPLMARRHIGYVPQNLGLPRDLTLREYLRTLAALDGLSRAEARIDRAMRMVHLTEVADRRLSAFSGGMKRRALLAQALLRDPPVLLVDAPTAGLDPYEQIVVWDLMRAVGRERVVLMATNLPEEAVEMPGRILVMDGGRLVAEASPTTLTSFADHHVFELPWSFRARVDGLVVPTARPETVLVISEAPPHQVARPVPPTPEWGYLYLLWRARQQARESSA
jgi:ABC-2 type transport system ATP-binding protein